MARQRYCRRLARYRNTLRVSADPAAKPAAHTRAESRGSRPFEGECGRETDSPLEGTGFELLVPRADGLGRRPQRYRCALARCLGGDAGCHHRTCLIRRWRERASNSRSGGWGELDRRAMSAERPEVSVRTNFGAGATALAWRERPLRRRGAPAISSRSEREPETTDEMRCAVASGASSMLAPTA
jgi:hypothetical protein